MKHVAYYRVSTVGQGISGLGIEAQKAQVRSYLKNESPILEFTEIESGKNDKRVQLISALDACKKNGYTLVIAKLDRLSRNLTFISSMMDAKIKFVCADMPEANEFTIHIFAALAQQERKLISERTKAALKALKDKGVKLGNPQHLGGSKAAELSKAARHARKNNNENNQLSGAHAQSLQKEGLNLHEIAKKLNEIGFKASRGGIFTPTQVKRIL